MNSLSTRLSFFLSDRGIKSTGGLLQELKDTEEMLDRVKAVFDDNPDHMDEKLEEIRGIVGKEWSY